MPLSAAFYDVILEMIALALFDWIDINEGFRGSKGRVPHHPEENTLLETLP